MAKDFRGAGLPVDCPEHFPAKRETVRRGKCLETSRRRAGSILPARALVPVLLLLSGASSAVAAAPKKHPAPAQHPVPTTPQPAWMLGKMKIGNGLSYAMPDGSDLAIAFVCTKSGDVAIRIPEASGKARADQSQSVSLTIGGVRSSFAGTVTEDDDAGIMLEIRVPSRNPLFTGLAGPGGMRIEGKGFAKNVPLRGVRDKLKVFLGGCRRS